jgi:hypothetical protein
MKTLLSAANGAITITENAGVFSLNLDESVSVGGGKAAGIVKVQGQGSVVLDGQTALALGQTLLNAYLPASLQPLATVVEGIVDQAIDALE